LIKSGLFAACPPSRVPTLAAKMIEMTICNAKGICFHDLYFFNVNLLILGFLQIKWRILDLTTVLGSIRSFVSQLNYEKLPDVLQIFTLYKKNAENP
jgi:uncharacterized membrane-anchored protein YitT (DUF2179 family)